MPDRHIRALRDKLETLLKTTRKLEREVAQALKKSAVKDSGDTPAATQTKRRVTKAARKEPLEGGLTLARGPEAGGTRGICSCLLSARQ